MDSTRLDSRYLLATNIADFRDERLTLSPCDGIIVRLPRCLERIMDVRYAVLLGALLLSLCSASANDKPTVNQAQFPPTYVPSGGLMFKQYCAPCHGADAKGQGPAAASLKTPPPDLTTLATRHDGKFPYGYVSDVLLLGPLASHGSAAMPTWGPIFLYLDKRSETAVRQRIKNLSDYLASLQVGQRPRDHETL